MGGYCVAPKRHMWPPPKTCWSSLVNITDGKGGISWKMWPNDQDKWKQEQNVVLSPEFQNVMWGSAVFSDFHVATLEPVRQPKKMAEDDEIDVLGDFNLDTLFAKGASTIYGNSSLVSQNTEILNCDYTIHPQWLLDRPSTNPDCWYDNSVGSMELTDRCQTELSNSYSDHLGHVLTENSISDESGWTEKEKLLLERGIDIFGKSNERLAQFIGSKTANEVKYYLKNFYSEVQPTYSSLTSGICEEFNNYVLDVLDDAQIPATMEEVISAVSTGKPTVQVNKRIHRKSSSSNQDQDEFGFSNIPRGPAASKRKMPKVRGSKYKFKFSMKNAFNPYKTPIKAQTQMAPRKQKIQSKNIINNVTTPPSKDPEFESEVRVTISKVDSDSDIEIDVEESSEYEDDGTAPANKQIKSASNSDYKSDASYHDMDATAPAKKPKVYLDLPSLEDHLRKQLTTLEAPKCEITIDENFVSDLEKLVHNEFFQKRPTKTPLRYLKIRNHIIGAWQQSKPSYVTKTSIRQGLKNCGDVNCISRIHCYLEQMGVINFGCRQTRYVRPLYELFQSMAPVTKEKAPKAEKGQGREGGDLGVRPRIRKRFLKDGDGGYTLTHGENGDVIHTTIVHKEPIKPRSYTKKPAVKLIFSKPFPANRSHHKVRIQLSALLLMDLHAHSSRSEIMGLVGGDWNPAEKILTISHYEPCRNIASSTTHCDMCPISQAKAAQEFHSRHLNILGWFHSHPTFASEPSQQDLDTQQDLQLWIGNRNPCIGLILTPFSAHGALIASPFTCLTVEKKNNFEDVHVPYKFDVQVMSKELNLKDFLAGARKIIDLTADCTDKVEWHRPYFLNHSVTHLEKYVTSVRMCLAKCGNFSKKSSDYVVENIERICRL